MTNAYKAVREDNMPVLRASKQFWSQKILFETVGKIYPESLIMGREPLFSILEESTILDHI